MDKGEGLATPRIVTLARFCQVHCISFHITRGKMRYIQRDTRIRTKDKVVGCAVVLLQLSWDPRRCRSRGRARSRRLLSRHVVLTRSILVQVARPRLGPGRRSSLFNLKFSCTLLPFYMFIVSLLMYTWAIYNKGMIYDYYMLPMSTRLAANNKMSVDPGI